MATFVLATWVVQLAHSQGDEDGLAMAHHQVVPFYPAASDDAHEGFVRIINHSPRAGEVRIVATDGEGTRFPTVTLAMRPGETEDIYSDDLEEGNAAKGLDGGTGTGVGDWWLSLSSRLDIEVPSYVRAQSDGLLSSMHDAVPMVENGDYFVPIFKPASDESGVSWLRLINP
ncbi:MAG: hypothetical protein F4089_14765, partial [Gammaproteobacteria bacterium]|nr:hypothetical protein [Gammaproteobacteria bacterium]